MEHVINDFETWVDCALCTPDMSHYKQRPGVQKIFLQYVMSLKSAIGECDNPFLETSTDILVLDTRDIVEKSVIANVYRIEALGCQQYGNIRLFNTPRKRQKTKTSGLVSSLKSDRNLFSRLYAASQFRDGNINDYFSR